MDGTHYSAFISYRHNDKDSKIAKAVQSGIENFRIPPQLKKKTGITRFDRVFRDEDELQISESLSGKLEKALDCSDYLIVICSPQYKESKWCLHEIEYFLEKHERSHILCVLSDGEPPAVFPDILMEEGEPLACDFRGNIKEAGKTELLRLASVMLGCEYDDLVRRQEQHRRKRLAAALGIILCLAAAAISYLLYSNARIRENYRQAQIQESRTLAAQSLNQLSDYNRQTAVRTALLALPDAGRQRPSVAEAEYALTKASYAYWLPWQSAETRRIDENTDITDIRVSRDGTYLFALDETGTVFVYETGTAKKVAGIPVFHTETIREVSEGPEGTLIAWTAEGVKCWDYLTGELIWQQELNYGAIGRAAVSPDGALAAASDIDAVQIMRADTGEKVASLMLPQETEEYIQDLKWSLDSSRIAVDLRADNQQHRLAIFTVETGELAVTEPVFAELSEFTFLPGAGLAAAGCPDRNVSYASADTVYLYRNRAQVCLFDYSGAVLWTAEIPYTQPGIRTEIFGVMAMNSPCILVSASDAVTLLSLEDGSVLSQEETGSSIVRVLYVGSDAIVMAADDGSQAMSWFESGRTILTPAFPENAADIISVSAGAASGNLFLVLKDGNVQFHEMTYDDSLEFAGGQGLGGEITSSVHDENRMAVTTDDTLVFYDPERNEQTKTVRFADNEAALLIGMTKDGSAVLLVTDLESGERSALLYDLESGEKTGSISLPGRDTYASEGYFDQLDDQYGEEALIRKRLLLFSQYSGLSEIAFAGGKLYSHEEDTDGAPVIHVIDAATKEDLSIRPAVASPAGAGQEDGISPGALRLRYGRNGFLPSFLVPSADGKKLYTMLQDKETGQQYHAVIDINGENSGKVTLLAGRVVTGGRIADWSHDGRLAYVTDEEIRVTDGENKKGFTLAFPGLSPIALHFSSEELLVVYPDGTLQRLGSGGEVLSVTQLSFRDAEYFGTESFSFTDAEGEVFIRYGGVMDVINLGENGAYPNACVPGGCAAYLEKQKVFIVCSADPSGDGSPETLHRIARFKRYSVQELVDRAKRQLLVQ